MKNRRTLSMLKGFAKSLLLDAAVVLSLTLCIFCVSACASLDRFLSAAAAPYAIYDTQIAERENLGIEFTFANLSGREIQSVKFSAKIGGKDTDSYDEDCYGAEEKEFVFCAVVYAGDAERIFIPFEDFCFDGDIEDCFVQSLFALEIIFEDGTVWQDSGGFRAL